MTLPVANANLFALLGGGIAKMTRTERAMLFAQIDTNNDGVITWTEIAAPIQEASYSDSEITGVSLMAIYRAAEVYSRVKSYRDPVYGLGGWWRNSVGFYVVVTRMAEPADDDRNRAADGLLTERTTKTPRRYTALFGPAKSPMPLIETAENSNPTKCPQHTPHILTGYRRITHSAQLCIDSLWYLHNETVNIYSHGFGAVFFVVLLLATRFLVLEPNGAQFADYAAFIIFHFAAVVCLTNSTVFHLFCCHSQPVQRACMKCDYVGIVVLIVGSMLASMYYGLYCHPILQQVYMAMASIAGIFTIFVNTSERFVGPKYRPMRTLLFISIGLLGLVPIAHGLLTFEEDVDLQHLRDQYQLDT
ncbi:hypothetical protein HK100_002018 [Physocladia obscura]|uniref:EF-hand domain-containing protein n=1 Tax=Physocladia obscura TaxID=109957 RepID=A0AAD5SXM1_9FUNG|nr:hypothetical protein HK100_002018 [Physocladia obscura]